MTSKSLLLTSLDLINTLLKKTSLIEDIAKPALIPDLKLVLLTFKAKIEDLLNQQKLNSVNHLIFQPYSERMNSYLQLLSEDSQSWSPKLREIHEDNIKIYTSRLFTISEYFDSVINFPESDLFALDKTHPRWVSLSQHVEYFHLDKKEKIMKKYEKLFVKIASSLAYIHKKGHKTHSKKNIMMLGIGSLYYMMQKQKALRKAHLLHTTPNLQTATYIMNLLETKTIRKLSKIVMKGIKYDQVIHVPRLATHVLEPYESPILNCSDPASRASQASQTKAELSSEPSPSHVMVRVLSAQRMPGAALRSKLIIHIHGGGFIAMSSASHQVYTNHWAEDLQVPVFSIDYRLAPAHPYPCALDDVWQVFNWLLHFGHSHFGVTPQDYVLVGDSAGGNLALALTYRILQCNLHPPKGLVLSYPALNLDKSMYSPSLMFSLEDLLVPHTFLKLCLDSYLGHFQDVHNPLVSPSFINKEIMQKLPPVRILVGTQDPFHDECWRFTERLADCGQDVKLAVFAGASHGGLNYCFKGGVKETRDMVKQASDWMQELLKLDNRL